jgi:hypothetical protein
MPSVYMNERFQGDETFSRLLDGSPEQACEASRRALLSQGYVIGFSEAGTVKATKRFQPDGDSHIEIVFNVVCVSDSKGGQVSTAYVSALQETYTIKKSQNSANIGVSALGSISVPLPATRESLVKVGSETIPAGEFYDRFFALTQRLLREMVSAQEG